MLLNHRLADAELINTVADGLDGLGYCFVLQVGEHLGLHAHDPGILGPRCGLVFRQTLLNNGEQIGARLRRNAFQHDPVRIALRVRFSDFRIIDLLGTELFLERFQRIIGVNVDGVINLHLQNEVGSAA